MGMESRNAAELVDTSQRTFPDVATQNPEQVRRVFAVSDMNASAALCRLALPWGMRRSELSLLMWEDLDLERDMLAVSRALLRGCGDDSVLEQMKTQSRPGRSRCRSWA